MQEQISTMIQAAYDGEASACEVHAELKRIESQVKAGIEILKSAVLDEARSFNKTETYYGGKWQIKTTPPVLDYSEDKLYVELNSSASARKKELTMAWKAFNEGKGFLMLARVKKSLLCQ